MLVFTSKQTLIAAGGSPNTRNVKIWAEAFLLRSLGKCTVGAHFCGPCACPSCFMAWMSCTTGPAGA